MSVFLLVVGICFLLIVFSQVSFFSPVRGWIETVSLSLQRGIIGADITPKTSEIDTLKTENQKLQTKLAKTYLLELENQAFRDQFAKSESNAKKLLPSIVISHRDSDRILLDKGIEDGVKKGVAVVSNDNLVGIVTGVTPHTAQVRLTISTDFSIAAATVKTNAIGVSKGQEDEGILFQNVLLSDSLEVSDFVATKGEEDIKKIGLPPGLIIGKIVSIDKKASALYQTAKIESLIDFTKLRLVFITLE